MKTVYSEWGVLSFSDAPKKLLTWTDVLIYVFLTAAGCPEAGKEQKKGMFVLWLFKFHVKNVFMCTKIWAEMLMIDRKDINAAC